MTSKLKITIDATEKGYKASIEEMGSTAFPVKLESTIKTSAKDRESLLGSFLLLGQVYGVVRGEAEAREPGDILWSRLESSGKRLYSRVLPTEVRDTIGRYESIDLLIDSNDAEVPFELFHDGDSFFCLKYPMGRQVRSKKVLKQKLKAEAKRLRVAVLYNSTGDLEGAQTEGREITGSLKNLDCIERVDSFSGEEVTKARFEEILTGEYDIVHYAGHVDYDDKDPEKSSFRLHDGGLSGREVRDILKGNPLLFVNACTSAKSARGLEGMASSFVYGGGEKDGVIGYIGSTWPLHDDGASFFAKTFYTNIGEGKSIGTSLVEARKGVLGQFGNDESAWASFVLYGDPSIKLVGEARLQAVVKDVHLQQFQQVSQVGTFFGVSIIAGSVAAVGLGAANTVGSTAINLGAAGIAISIISTGAYLVAKLVRRLRRV